LRYCALPLYVHNDISTHILDLPTTGTEGNDGTDKYTVERRAVPLHHHYISKHTALHIARVTAMRLQPAKHNLSCEASTFVTYIAPRAGNEGNEGKDTFTVTKKTTVNSISCTANAESTAIAYARDAHVNALAEAHKTACSGGKTKKSIVSVWEKDVAVAVAKVSRVLF
jgi:hypothetical protein